MAAYDTLRAAIDSYIKANGNKEITGTVLNDILNAMVSALGADTRFAGVAVPSTNPGNPEGNVVYFASQAGTYSNFGGIVLPLGIHILVWNGTAWTSQTWFSVDNTPTQNSQNLATSGGILQTIVDAVGVERLRAIGVEVTSCSFDSNTKKISFFNSANTTLFQLDATAFVIDGMVSDVKIEGGNLVIQFNTDAGKQDIEIPLTDIFNPANYYTKTAIDALLALYYTKTETDALLTAINNKLADGCLYRGIAEPTTNPPTPTTKVFYIATKAGTYTNFGNIAVTEGITILKYDGSDWSKEQISYSDGVFDISAYNGTSYADLSAALGTDGANIPQNLRKGGMSVKFVQSSDNKYVQYRLMSDSFNTTVTNWQGVDDEPTAGSKNFVYSDGVYNSQYQRTIEIEGVGDTFKEVSIGKFEKGQKVYCHFNPWAATSASTATIIFRIKKVVEGVATNVYVLLAGSTIPTSYEFLAEDGAEYYFGGRADVGSSINGLFTYNCIDEEGFNEIKKSLNEIPNLKASLFKNNCGLVYNAEKVVIDNDARTITFGGNTAVIDTQGLNNVTLMTNNKSASFTADVPDGGFSGSAMAVLVYKPNETLAVKQYDKLAATDYALIGLKFDKPLGNGSTARTDTKVISYISLLPVEVSDPIENMIIVEKRDSLNGIGNNTFMGPKIIGELTAGQTYYVYVNNYNHTSAETGLLFAVKKDDSYMFVINVGSDIPTNTFVYSFVAEEGAVYSYGGRCDIGDSIDIEFLATEKYYYDVDTTKEINRNNAFSSLLNEATVSVERNTKKGSFLYVTDLHSNLSSLKEMVRIKSILGLTSRMINGGDIVGGWPRTPAGQAVIDEYMQICIANNIYHVVGQHEVGFTTMADPDGLIGRRKTDVYSNQETFNRYFAPLKNSWGLSNLDKCYYYKDFGDVRLIALYHYNRPEVDDPEDSDYYKYQRALVWYGTEQLQWFADTLGSMSEGQIAVILCHQPTVAITPLQTSKFQAGFSGWAPNTITADDPITEIITAFKNKTQIVKTYIPTDTTKYLVSDGFEESVNADFSNSKGTLGFMVMGDNHFDAVGKASNILCLCLTACGECSDGVVTVGTGYNSDYIINAFGVGNSRVELGRVGQQYFCGTLRDIERLSYNT